MASLTPQDLFVITPSFGMTDMSLVQVEEFLSSSKTLFLNLRALPSLPHTPRSTSGYSFPSTPTSFLNVCCTVHQTVMTPFTPHCPKTRTKFYPIIRTLSSLYVVTSIVIMPVHWVWVPLSPAVALQQRTSATHWD